jgi:alkanesulfonate monooxygenase SsuD/methylene tetrahydromethanopterin reductase-like flavin-dependent oxidoreductase (luciferase family)
MAPKSQELCAEIADGLLLTSMHPERFDVLEPRLRAGFAKAGGKKNLDTFDVAPAVGCIIGSDLDGCRLPLKMSLALYIGGMGAKDKNFYSEYMRSVGFEAAAARIQSLYLDGKRDEAIAAVPDELVDALHLVGPPERIRERFTVWKQLPIGTLLVATQQVEALRLLAELAGS